MAKNIFTKSREPRPRDSTWDAITREYENDVTRFLRLYRNRAEADEQVEKIRANLISRLRDFREHLQQLPQLQSDPTVDNMVKERIEECERECNRMKKFNAHRERFSEKGAWQFVRCPKNAEWTPGWKRVKAFCTCGGLYYDGAGSKNCAHMLCDMLIKGGKLTPWPDNCVCCPAGRPIVASQVRDYIFTGQVADPDADERYYIFCIGPGSKGHVYYGTRDQCIHGTGASGRYGSSLTAIEYYADIKDTAKWAFEKLDVS